MVPVAGADRQLDALFRKLLSDGGFRVLAVAVGTTTSGAADLKAEDEHDLMLVGLLAFAHPLKPGVDGTVARLTAAGVTVRMITGDNRYAAAHIAAAVGLDTSGMITGVDLDGLSDDELSERLGQATVASPDETSPGAERLSASIRRRAEASRGCRRREVGTAW